MGLQFLFTQTPDEEIQSGCRNATTIFPVGQSDRGSIRSCKQVIWNHLQRKQGNTGISP